MIKGPTEHKVARPLPLKALSEEPLVSVLLSNYNYEDYIGEAIESVLTQSYRNVEVIVCDDGSTDGSAHLIEKYAAMDTRVNPIFKDNGGQASGFNTAYAAASGDVICLLDADDSFEPDKIATAVARLRSGEYGIFLHRLVRVDKQGSPMPHHSPHAPLKEGWIATDKVASGMNTWCPEPTTAMSFRREVADLVFPIPESMRICADSFVFALLPLLTTLAVSDEQLGRRRLHGANSYSREFQTLENLTQERDRVIMVTEEVNRRLDSLSIDDLQLDARRGVTFHELGLRIDLLKGRSRTHLLSSYARTMRRMIRRREFSRRGRGKAEAAFVYAIAIALPPRYRRWWLSDARKQMKMVARRTAARIRRLSRRRAEETRP